jgi:pyrimidine-nucleoside phosphorylase
MNMYDIIAKKRDGNKLSFNEFEFWLKGYVEGSIPDYQSAAMLMAVFLNGLDEDETNWLTSVIVDSGECIYLNSINGIKVDKHSSGGVGDKTTLLVAPIAAAADLKFAKMSGRGLGHTGGTLDKLEAIPGFEVEMSVTDFRRQVKKDGIAVISQSENIVPADKKLYALRDVTATVNSIPLIAASIMAKKLATGADIIVLDVKYGSGAFIKTPEDAIKLAETMVKIGLNNGKKVSALISSMEAPLGYAVGNSLEVDEVVEALRGEGPDDLLELSTALAGELIYMSKVKTERKAAVLCAKKLLDNGSAWKKLLALVKAQGGSINAIKDNKLTHANYVVKMASLESGYIESINALAIGRAARDLGAGRLKKEDSINPNVGIVFHYKVGDVINKGDCLATLYADDVMGATQVGGDVLAAVKIMPEPVEIPDLIYGIVDEQGFTPWLKVL